MVDTIERALNPLRLTAFFFGFGILKYPLSHPRLRFSIFYILIMWSIYAYVFYYVVIIFAPRSIFNGFFNFFVIMMNLCVTIISVIIVIHKHKELHICVRKIGLVDDTLEELGMLKEYRKMQNSVKWALIIWIIIICITSFLDSLWYIEKFNDTKAIVIPLIKNYSLHINTLMDIKFMLLLRYIGTRLDKVNDYIEQLSETEEYGLRCAWKKSLVTRHYIRNAKNRKRVLWIAMHLHSELCHITRDINVLFGMPMTLQMISCFVVLIWMFYFQYHTMLCLTQVYGGNKERLRALLCSDVWFILYLIKLISFNHICENVSAKAQKTRDVIHKLTNLIYFSEAREEICQFLLQISFRPLKFSGMGLFYFGYKFIAKFFAWIITAVVFLIQMNTSTISRLIISDRNNVTCYDYIGKNKKL